MAITARPKTPGSTTLIDEAAIDKFIGSAPDAAIAKDIASSTKVYTGTFIGKQAQIQFALPPGLLTKVDEQAQKLSISRAVFMKQALTRAVEAKLEILKREEK
jgi:hypothetical protein